MEASAQARELLAVLEAEAGAEALSWLRRGLPQPGASFARGLFFGFYAGAGRRFRQPDLAPNAELRARLAAAGVLRAEVWTLSDLARAALLLSAATVVPEPDQIEIATEAFRKGDSAERIALLRSLPLLPAGERLVPLAVEACRTHVLDVFAAMACENPYPARHFPELNFNQLVIKTLFCELALDRVIGWRDRQNSELVRMAGDYEAERRAAGRSVPADIALIKAAKEVP